jgi:hypothetical protein
MVNYHQPPDVALDKAQVAWAAERLRAIGQAEDT